MDFTEGLSLSRGTNVILVVVDTFNKYAHFLALKQYPYTTSEMAQRFLEEVYRLHGLSKAITSNRDKIFTSLFRQELFRGIGTELRMSTSYHPQTDGKTERVNQSLKTYLHYMTHQYHKQWQRWLHLVE